MRHPSLTAWLCVATAAVCVAAPAQGPAPGLRLYEPENVRESRLLDRNGAIVHRWPGTMFARAQYLLDDGSLLRTIKVPGSPIGPNYGAGHNGLRRVAFDGSLLWDYRNPTGTFTHHDIAPLPNGNVLMIAWDEKTAAEALAHGRNPSLLGARFLPDKIIEVQPTGPTSGQIVWEWRIWDHVVQDFAPLMPNFGVVEHHPELLDLNFPFQNALEFNHANGLDYDPIHDWIMISFRKQSEVYVIDHGTTTAEAAGHTGGRWGKGGDLLYRWGNAPAYRVQGSSRVLNGQHGPRFIPPGYPGAGNVTVFNNELVIGVSSAVFELVLPLDPVGNFILSPGGQYGPATPCWSYSAPGFHSAIMSSAQRLPNGNTLVCSATQQWLFEVTPAGQIVWQHQGNEGRMFHAHHTERTLWGNTDSVSAANGGRVDFDLVEGTSASGEPYLVLCSASGTAPGWTIAGVTVPLNIDAMLLASLNYFNFAPVFSQTFGTFRSSGSAQAAFTLPPNVVPTGFRLDFGYVQFSASLMPVRASNTVPVAAN